MSLATVNFPRRVLLHEVGFSQFSQYWGRGKNHLREGARSLEVSHSVPTVTLVFPTAPSDVKERGQIACI